MIDRVLLKPARQHNESYPDYCARRAEGNRQVKLLMQRGRMIWQSVKNVTLKLNAKGFPVNPLAEGEDAIVKSEIKIRKRMKGTYRKPFASRTRRGV